MIKAEKKKIEKLIDEITNLKKNLTEQNGFTSNADAKNMLNRIGELLTEKNELTGQHEDAQYLYFDDGEWLREVKGFIGDNSGMIDFNGQALMIGDTISLNGYSRIVMHNLPSQDTITKCRSIKIKDYNELDIRDAFANVFTISLRSCLKDYENSLKHDMELTM